MPVVKLVEVSFFYLTTIPGLGGSVATTLFDRLLQLDVRDATVTIPRRDGPGWRLRDDRRRMVEDLRTMALVLSTYASERLKTCLRSIAEEPDRHKVKKIKPFGAAIARFVPQELADLVIASLAEPEEYGRPGQPTRDRALSFDDAD